MSARWNTGIERNWMEYRDWTELDGIPELNGIRQKSGIERNWTEFLEIAELEGTRSWSNKSSSLYEIGVSESDGTDSRGGSGSAMCNIAE
jgi:hypothetical protein